MVTGGTLGQKAHDIAPLSSGNRVYMTAPQQAVQMIQQRIAQGEWKPGDQLPSQRDLSEQLGLSRASLREAVSILETVGIVRAEAGRGVFVCDRKDGQAVPDWRYEHHYSEEDVYQVRLCIEPETAAFAALRLDMDQLKLLEANVARMKEALGRDDMVQAFIADSEFHGTIVGASNNRLFTEIYANIAPFVEETQRRPLINIERIWDVHKEHAEILAALKQRIPHLAYAAMKQHLLNSASRIGIRMVSFFPLGE